MVNGEGGGGRGGGSQLTHRVPVPRHPAQGLWTAGFEKTQPSSKNPSTL